MKTFLRPIFNIVRKDVLLETRSKDIIIAVLVFSILVIVVFNFTIEITPHTAMLVAPGVLWVSIVFGGVLGLTRSIALEMENGNLRGLLLIPVEREAIFFGKVASNLLFMLVVEAIVLPIFGIMFNISIAKFEMFLICTLTTLGIATVGTVFATIAASTRAREVMLPLLFLPATLPAILGAVKSTGLLIGADEFGDMSRWIILLVCFDAAFLIVAPWAFRLIVEE